MKKGTYKFFLLHLSLFFGAVIFQNLGAFLILSALAGFMPRVKRSFGYFLIASLLGLILALLLNNPHPELNARISDIVAIKPVPFWAIVVLVSSLTMALVAVAVNRLALPRNKA